MAQPLDPMQLYQGYQTAESQNALRAQSMQESGQLHPLQVQQLQQNMLAKRRAMDDEDRQRGALMEYQRTGNLNALASVDPKYALELNQMRSRENIANQRLNMLGQRQAARTNAGGRPVWDGKRGVFVLPPSAQNPNGSVVTPGGVPALAKEEKALTEAQGNATGFGIRAALAADNIADLEESGTFGRMENVSSGTRESLNRIPVIGTAAGNILGGLSNSLVTAPQQKYAQSKGDFIRAVLRKESGATISNEETDNADRQYFPVFGDSSDVIKQKALNRRTALESLKIQAGPGAKNIPASRRNSSEASPAGVDEKLWAVMTPEERKLWQK